jgi:hypothetical protein
MGPNPETALGHGIQPGPLPFWSIGPVPADGGSPDGPVASPSTAIDRPADFASISLKNREPFGHAFARLSFPANLPEMARSDSTGGPPDHPRWSPMPRGVADPNPRSGEDMTEGFRKTNELLQELIDEVKRGRDPYLPPVVRPSGPLR